MKNKGITLVELIISISLISIVIVFLFTLLVDVKANDNRIDYARDNQQNRAIIIKRVQDDFLDYGLIGLNTEGSTKSVLKINFKFQSDKESTLMVEEKAITYTSVNEEQEKWKLANEIAKYNIHCVKYEAKFLSNNDYFTIWFRIPLSVKEESKNVIDDLEFFYLGKRFEKDDENFPTGTNILENYNQSQCR